MQEDNIPIRFGHSNVVITHARKHIRQLGQFVIMGGKQCFCAQLRVIVDIFNDCPGDGDSIVCTGAAADFIQDEQAAGGGMVENVCHLDHLHHKCGLPGMDFILCADPSKNAINQSEFSRAGRDK